MEKSKLDGRLYQELPQMILGFHGCDKSVAMDILNSTTKHLTASNNSYDWLGDGIYFWLNDPQRAYEWADKVHKRNPEKIKEPFVIGAVIDLGVCLNFCEREAIQLLQKSYEDLKAASLSAGYDIDEKLKNKVPDDGGFNLIRPLDCAVIKNLHEMMKKQEISFDTVYGYFQEGCDAFPGAGIKEKSHIQISVRNKRCIKGYFLPREI